MKVFNTTAVCVPSKHYMVDLSERVAEIKKMVDAGEYFTINRARQYGKTTTLDLLCQVLESEYAVISLDFQDIEDGSYQNGSEFSKAFARILLDAHEFDGLRMPELIEKKLVDLVEKEAQTVKMDDLFRIFRHWFRDEIFPMVLIIDEVDQAANSQVFLDFLAGLRSLYLKREKNSNTKTFQSVILSGVTDVKHLKGRIRTEDEHKVNSPWNIAADFNIDMSLSEPGIKGMLDDYEADHHTGMNTGNVAKWIREYTNGYPFLVSRICQLMDENVSRKRGLSDAWKREGFDEAVKLLLAENNSLFQSLTKNLDNLPELKKAIRSILMEGTRLTWNGQQDAFIQMQMYGLIRNDHNTVRISNRIFETMLYNRFLSDEELKSDVFSRKGDLAKNIFVKNDQLNVRLILEHFISTFHQVYGPLEEKFREKDGRELFLLYLKPIINGTGNYYIEAQTRDQRRTDVIIDYLGKQYIIELKIWRGERYNEEGERQILEYLDYFGLSEGYMLSFNFNRKKDVGVKTVNIGDKILLEGTV